MFKGRHALRVDLENCLQGKILQGQGTLMAGIWHQATIGHQRTYDLEPYRAAVNRIAVAEPVHARIDW